MKEYFIALPMLLVGCFFVIMTSSDAFGDYGSHRWMEFSVEGSKCIEIGKEALKKIGFDDPKEANTQVIYDMDKNGYSVQLTCIPKQGVYYFINGASSEERVKISEKLMEVLQGHKNRIKTENNFSVKLKEVEFYKAGKGSDIGCNEIMVREIYDIKNIDPIDLVYVSLNTKGSPYITPIKSITSEGEVLWQYCAPHNFSTLRTVRFMTFSNGKLSNTITYKIDAKGAKLIEKYDPPGKILK